jgi:hypothetical protein
LDYNSSRTLPTFYFYNGLVETDPYIVDTWALPTGTSINAFTQTNFPYFDHYNVVSGSFPTVSSRSLLFQNENTSYGSIPSGSLYTTSGTTGRAIYIKP